MAKPRDIELPTGDRIPIIYEDRSALAIDKPAGWMLAPSDWTRTRRNLQLALESSLKMGDYWAKSRSLKFLRYVHRLDAPTSGATLFAKSPGALAALSELFESREVLKAYLAVLSGSPKRDRWTCTMKLSEALDESGRIQIDHAQGREAETEFMVLARKENCALVEVFPRTGRTHQIRVHAAATQHPVAGDPLYNPAARAEDLLALRSIRIEYRDPFTRRAVRVRAETASFLKQHGFSFPQREGAGHDKPDALQ